VTRSTSLVSKILPDLDTIYSYLVKIWGEENAASVCRVDIYVTDKDQGAVKLLKRELQDTFLFRSGCVHFGRPDFGKVIENHTLDCITTTRNSYSLLAFCGSPEIAGKIHQVKIGNDMVTNITGNGHHQMEFVAESYGGHKTGHEDLGGEGASKGVDAIGAVSDTSSDAGSGSSPDPGGPKNTVIFEI
jgi:hypothetical protein